MRKYSCTLVALRFGLFSPYVDVSEDSNGVAMMISCFLAIEFLLSDVTKEKPTFLPNAAFIADYQIIEAIPSSMLSLFGNEGFFDSPCAAELLPEYHGNWGAMVSR